MQSRTAEKVVRWIWNGGAVVTVIALLVLSYTGVFGTERARDPWGWASIALLPMLTFISLAESKRRRRSRARQFAFPAIVASLAYIGLTIIVLCAPIPAARRLDFMAMGPFTLPFLQAIVAFLIAPLLSDSSA